MDRIDAMEAFVAVADLRGFAPAARKLGLSPSGVTRLIAALEDRLGARLLQRTTRKVALTDVGSRYLERARRILAGLEEAEPPAGGGREFRIPGTPGFATNSADAAIQHAERGGGLTRVLAYQAADAIKAGRLKIVLQKFEQPPLPIHLVYPTSRLLSAKVRTFIDLVIEISDWHFGG